MSEFIKIETSDFEDVAMQFGALAHQIPALTFRAVDRVGRQAVDYLKQYPPRFSGQGPGFKSERQRRWFFAALRAGQISVPYQRSGILGRGWRVTAHGQTQVEVTNDTEYTKWVQVQSSQARIHQGRWRTVEEAIAQMPDWASQSADKLGDEIISAFNATR